MRHIVVGSNAKHKILKIGVISLTIIIIILVTPQIALANTQWNLQITSPNGTTTSMTYEELLALPQTNVTATLVCYGTPLAYGEWQGIKLLDILNQTGLNPSVVFINFGAQDGYIINIPIDTAMRQDVIVAYAMNGVPLPENLRLIVPDANGNIWISMITTISMSTTILSSSMTPPDQTVLSQNQYLNHVTNNLTPQPAPQQPQPTPSAKKDVSEPTATPTNIIQPSPVQKMMGQEASNFSFQSVYFVIIAVVVTLVSVVFVGYRRQKLKV